MNKKNIALVTARLRKNLRQYELAKDLSMHHTTYSQIESGRILPDHETRVKIAARLGVKQEDIFSGE